MNLSAQRFRTLSFLLPAGLFGVSIVYLIGCLELSPGTLALPAEGFVPVLFGFLFFGGSGLLMIRALAESQEPSDRLERTEITKVLLLIGIFFLYVIVLPVLGFSLSTFGMILGTGKIMEARFRTSLLVALCVIVFSFLLFKQWLNVPLPSSVFS